MGRKTRIEMHCEDMGATQLTATCNLANPYFRRQNHTYVVCPQPVHTCAPLFPQQEGLTLHRHGIPQWLYCDHAVESRPQSDEPREYPASIVHGRWREDFVTDDRGPRCAWIERESSG